MLGDIFTVNDKVHMVRRFDDRHPRTDDIAPPAKGQEKRLSTSPYHPEAARDARPPRAIRHLAKGQSHKFRSLHG
jgi:hypothetical protein